MEPEERKNHNCRVPAVPPNLLLQTLALNQLIAMRLFFLQWLPGFLLVVILATGCASTGPFPAGQPTPIVVRILDLDRVPITIGVSETATPAPSPTVAFLPTRPSVEPAASATPAPSSGNPAAPPSPTIQACRNAAEIVKYLAIGNNTVIEAGQAFAVIWQLKNTGTCAWTADYHFDFYSGEAMGSPVSQPLQAVVPPGETVDLRLSLVAPTAPGTHTGNWAIVDAIGNPFGLGPDANQPVFITIQVPRPKAPTPS